MVLTWDDVALLVNLGNVDLDRGVVLGLDDLVGGGTLSWDVKLNLTLVKNMFLGPIDGLVLVLGDFQSCASQMSTHVLFAPPC